MFSSPLISVIVAAHDLQGGLTTCLQSVLAQGFRDIEVIVVADASPDCPSGVIGAAESDDDRVTVVRLDFVAGIGALRNAGAERARGSYLLFLDSDHVIWDGILEAMADRVRTLDSPDVLLFGHTRLHRGRSWPGGAAEVLSVQDAKPFSSVEQPQLFGVPAYIWDRLIRRELWTATGVAFPDGMHEEIPVVHRLMLDAASVGVLKWDCVQLRRRHTVHPAGGPEGSQFDVFGRYEESFALLAEHGRVDAVPFLFTRMVRQYLFLLNLSGCLGRSERSRFFQRAAEHYQRFQPEGYERPAGREGVKFQLLGNGGYAAFQTARLPNVARGVLSRS
ncbi:glycosyltransferase family 2 protein [Streptacidiphilus jiangxiensis]|uniref:CDP-glycerol glycerophosphotransferase n=1 Tax=Streptacidiphilus jiangxiensis TaxID=235985 RepID=A0A1H7QGR9_STRJI|nr:glycosyltransferase family 2 protein [Streptacidiphilus jiangxiensis]SEL47172.1 CDP-glycerol glycerophosphotransferase [Streptacidiphilus jiangxiensis]